MPLPPSPANGLEPDSLQPVRCGDRLARHATALEQAEAGVLRGNGLPERWRGRAHFVILDTRFGLGHRFLATWAAWLADPERPGRLFFLGVDAQPAQARDLAHAHTDPHTDPHTHAPHHALVDALCAQWPPRVPGWHRLDFSDGAVQLLLAFGGLDAVLPQWQAAVDAFFLDGFAPEADGSMERADLAGCAALGSLQRLAAPGATAAEAKSTGRVLRFAPRHRSTPPPGRAPLAPGAQDAIVLGAGIAGAACARALHAAGVRVQVLEAASGPAQGASGNAAGLFHGTVHADDGPHARWNRAAALRCRQWLLRHPSPWAMDGLLRLSPGESALTRHALAERLDLDPAFAAPLDAMQASQRAALALDHGGWLFPSGGALPPCEWVPTLLQGLPLRTGVQVAALQSLPEGRWALLDAQGKCLAETGLLVLACGHALPSLLAPLDPHLAARLQTQRGQVSRWFTAPSGPLPALPLAAGGYVIAPPTGGLVAGATATLNDPDPTPRAADDAHNHAVAQRLLGRPLPAPDAARVGWRLLAPDKLPVVGGVIDPLAPPPQRPTQAAHWPRRTGLLLCGALASRGLTWAPLAAELLVAQALGWPAPVPRGLMDAVDPARFHVRAHRQGRAR